jgi:uncharacterized membrane protein YuzA (DUF378 family)
VYYWNTKGKLLKSKQLHQIGNIQYKSVVLSFPLLIMCQKSPLGMVAFTLVIIGALNWGLVGLGTLIGATSSWNVVELLIGRWPMFTAIVYLLVGLAAIYKLVSCKKCCGGNEGGGCCSGK